MRKKTLKQDMISPHCENLEGICNDVLVCESVHMNALPVEALYLPELELQAAVSLQEWVLGTNSGSLEEQRLLLTDESSPAPVDSFDFFFNF